jgi:ribosomal protein S18 acetylase RimI-like enzyme
MSYTIKLDTEDINWIEVRAVIEKSGLSTRSVELTEKAFKNSYRIVFIFNNDKLIGTGRAISDGIAQAAIYDIAVLPEYQKQGIGNLIMETLQEGLTGMNILLYANPTAQNFYSKLGYSKMLTGMARFKNEDIMRQRGFIE